MKIFLTFPAMNEKLAKNSCDNYSKFDKNLFTIGKYKEKTKALLKHFKSLHKFWRTPVTMS